MIKMAKTPIKELVKDPEWQKVRESLLGQWNIRPEWCCQQLRQYLGPINKTEDKKLRITMNYLTGTGFRMGKINHPCIHKLRGEISAEMKKRKIKK